MIQRKPPMSDDSESRKTGVATPDEAEPARETEVPVQRESAPPPRPEDVYRRRRGWLGAIIVLVAAGGVCALAMLPGRKEDKPAAKRLLTKVTVQPVVSADFTDTIDLPGVVQPDRTVMVSARVAGTLVKIACKEGDPCNKGGRLIVLDGERLSVRLAQAEALVRRVTAQVSQAGAERDLAKLEVETAAKLHEQNAATDFTLKQAKDGLRLAEAGVEQAEAGLAEAEAARKAAKLDLGYATITAPIDGVLDEVLFEEGELVAAGDPVVRIVDVVKVRVVVDVPQRDIRYVKPGHEETVLPDLEAGPDGPKLTGTVVHISKLADPDARTTRVEVLVDNASGELRSGRPVLVRLRRRVIKQAVMVPLEAITQLESGRAVYIVEDGEAARRLVALGVWSGRQVQILPDQREGWGLRAGEMLIVRGHQYVAPGQAVEIVKPEPATQPSSQPSGPGPAVRQ